MHKTTLYLDDDLFAELRRLSDATGKTQAALIREALRKMTAASTSRPKSVGMGRSGRRSLSEQAEKLLDGFGET